MNTREGAHAAVALPQHDPTSHAPNAGSFGASMRLVDAIGRVEPTWVEAVAVVQAVCGQLEPGQALPGLDDVMLSQSGTVSFPPTEAADNDVAVKAAGRLLTAILRRGDCPMPVWEATELARRSPGTFGSARAFGESLTCFPPHQGPQELAAYFQSSRRIVCNSARPATAVFARFSLTARALLVILAVTSGGVGAGMSVGALLASRTVPQQATRVAGPSASAGAVTRALMLVSVAVIPE